jgi:uncharacterized protein (DUF58 family)
MHAGAPRHVPRGMRPTLEELIGLRRHGAEMRRLLGLDVERRVGQRASAARSQGMDYAESRPYSPGDDVRRIDWRITARTGRAHTKLYQAEPGSDLYCLVDLRAPMHFGTRAAFKSVLAAHLAALAAWAAAEGGERFGALVAGAPPLRVAPGAAQGAASALCAALAADPAGDGAALDTLAALAARDTAVGTRFVVVSDFSDDEDTLARALKALRARGELVLVWVFDPLEVRPPPPACYAVTDGREQLVLDAASPAVRAAQLRDAAARRARVALLCASRGTLCRAVATGEDLFAALARPLCSA